MSWDKFYDVKLYCPIKDIKMYTPANILRQ
jgi:hypothetical protein